MEDTVGNLIRKHHISFLHAWEGLKWAFSTQPNFRIHLTLAIIALALGLLVELSYGEWVLLIFTIFWGLGAEMINTSLEAMTDLIEDKWHEQAKIAKDVAAGMMLVTAFGTILVACLLIAPKLLNLFWHILL